MVCCGKAMGGGIPISALIGKKKYLDIPKIGSMSSTHSANPMACAAGLAVINEINQKKLIKAQALEDIITSSNEDRITVLKELKSRLVDSTNSGYVQSNKFKEN